MGIISSHSHSHSTLLPPHHHHLFIIIMSDAGRQSFTDKATAALKPDSEKSTTEHFGDKFKGNADSAGSTLEPQSQKSTSQRVGDAFSSNNNSSTEPSLTQKAKNAVGLGNNN
ncbi:heat shock protein 9/12-domain-containing protein [Lenzites betulinus]|nr:heat shock protein 9/12-domain-containing protein [Lenzites betulinus]